MEEERQLSEDISLREILDLIKGYINELFKNWWLIGIFCILFGGGFLYKHFQAPVLYRADLKFAIEGSQNASGGIMGGLLGSFGIGQQGTISPHKLLEIADSYMIAEKILNTKLEDSTLLANRIIDVYDLQKKWGEINPRFLDFVYTEKSISEGNKRDRKGFKKLKKVILGNVNKSEALLRISINEETKIFTIYSLALDEEISYTLVNSMYKSIREYFEVTALESQLKFSEVLKQKMDSIDHRKSIKSFELAKFNNSNRGAVTNFTKSKEGYLAQEINFLNISYGEILKNYEMTDAKIKNMQPLFLTLNTPLTPLDRIESSLLSSLIIGMILGFIIGCVYIVIRKIFRDALK